MRRIAGIDGCKAGWFVVSADATLDSINWFIAENIDSAAHGLRDHVAAGIDIPVGIPDAGPRDCDGLARKRLSPLRGTSVFPAPIRQILKCRDHTEASDRRESIDGKRISAQLFHILHKIDEVDAYLRYRSANAPQFYEVHPELAFAALQNHTPMAHGKRTATGHAQRLALLSQSFGEANLNAALATYPRSRVARDDILDAFAVLLSTRRIVSGKARRVPDESQFDSAGLEMAIWF
ncbi:MAG: DUF429 domain-containing protein [Woeseiaceae bacterium]|nr:DUF429 domain-containing protein [Woeseiaceae bacterium]